MAQMMTCALRHMPEFTALMASLANWADDMASHPQVTHAEVDLMAALGTFRAATQITTPTTQAPPPGARLPLDPHQFDDDPHQPKDDTP